MSKRDGGMFHARRGVAGIRGAQQKAKQVRAVTERLRPVKPNLNAIRSDYIECFNPAAQLLQIGEEYHIDGSGSKGIIIAIDTRNKMVRIRPHPREGDFAMVHGQLSKVIRCDDGALRLVPFP